MPSFITAPNSTGETGRGLLVRTQATAGREFHPAPKERHIQLPAILQYFSLSGNEGVRSIHNKKLRTAKSFSGKCEYREACGKKLEN